MVPSTVVMPREGSFALASFGRVRNVQEPAFAVAAGRKTFALKRIVEAVLVIFLSVWFGSSVPFIIIVSRTSPGTPSRRRRQSPQQRERQQATPCPSLWRRTQRRSARRPPPQMVECSETIDGS